MQRFREMNDSRYYKGKEEHEKRLEWQRRQGLSLEELQAEQKAKEQEEENKRLNYKKIKDMVDPEDYPFNLKDTVSPSKRSFLIQPSKDDKKVSGKNTFRMP